MLLKCSLNFDICAGDQGLSVLYSKNLGNIVLVTDCKVRAKSIWTAVITHRVVELQETGICIFFSLDERQ